MFGGGGDERTLTKGFPQTMLRTGIRRHAGGVGEEVRRNPGPDEQGIETTVIPALQKGGELFVSRNPRPDEQGIETIT